MSRRFFARTSLVSLLTLTACQCGGGDDTPPGTTRCELDLTKLPTTGTGATARVATASDLFTGEAASGKAGDFLLQNDRIRVLVEQPGRVIGPQPFGGNIIDADVVRASGETGRERFGELGLLFNLGRTVDVERVDIVRDGSDGGAAVLAATGLDQPDDFIHLSGLLKQYLTGLDLPDSDLDLPLRITHWYVLEPGADHVQVHTMLCNDGDEDLAMPVGDLVDSGGEVEGLAGRTGFGTTSGDPSAIAGALGESDGEPFFAWVGEGVTYGYVPVTQTNQFLTVAGVTGSLLDTRSLLAWTRGPDNPPADAHIVPAHGSSTFERDFVVGRSPSDTYDRWYERTAAPTGTVSGRVMRGGAPVVNARVVAKLGDEVVQLFATDPDGRFSGHLPPGELVLQADDGVSRTTADTHTVTAGTLTEATLELPALGTLVVHARDANGPIPAKVTVTCPDHCAVGRTSPLALLFRDTKADALPTTNGVEVFDYAYVGPAGDVTFTLPAGDYRVFVSRGPEWDLFRTDTTIGTNAPVTLDATLRHVVDTTGWASGDLHVHAINSPDSPIGNDERLRSFLAEGVDLIVSTDHDYVTDLTPMLAAIPDGPKWMRAVTGVELTTFDYGHYNGFPVTRDAASRNGGAIDWAGGTGPGMSPKAIFGALKSQLGATVVQANHPNSGFFTALGLDTRTLWTRAPADGFRIGGVTPDTATGDTRLFDEGFTAFELFNGFSNQKFELLSGAWFALMNRGLFRTATAVSDTHKRHGNAGYPRTYVEVADDSPARLDLAGWATALNAGAAFGTSGPFLQVRASAGNDSAGPGGTLVTGARTVTVSVDVRMPAWMDVDRARLYSNVAGTETTPSGSYPSTLPDATRTLALAGTLDEGTGQRTAHAEAELTLERDAWIVVTVDGPTDLFPVVGKGGTKPFAYTNAIRVDLDGNGWTPPVDLAAERARVGRLETDDGQGLVVKATEADLRRTLARECGDE